MIPFPYGFKKGFLCGRILGRFLRVRWGGGSLCYLLVCGCLILVYNCWIVFEFGLVFWFLVIGVRRQGLIVLLRVYGVLISIIAACLILQEIRVNGFLWGVG